jgi:ABC-2 type transport system ATP-binding protein
MNAIEITNLSKAFKGKKGAVVAALKDVSLDIPAGEVFGFLGPNGAGKSTTIKTLMGLIIPTSGEAKIMGKDVKSHLSRQHVGYLPENPAFYEYLSALEYLSFVGAAFRMPEELIRRRSDDVLSLLDLREAARRPIRSYSKGMVQRLGLAQALLHDPEVYILDEPMSGLDPIGRALVKNIILDLKRRGKSVFFSTHITADVETVCDRVGIIFKGELKSVEQVQVLLSQGISRYRIHVVKEGGRAPAQEVYVQADRLSAFIAHAQARGAEIRLVEPERKDLEQFFLDIVKEKSC